MTVMEEIALRQTLRIGLILLGLAFALIYAAAYCYRGPSRGKTLVKSVPMPAFALSAAVSFGNPLIIAALMLSALGDAALSRRGDRAFLVGLVGFALAHVLYIVLFWTSGGGLAAIPGWAIVAMLLFAASTELWLIPHTDTLRWPVRVYVGLIALMALAALSLQANPLAVAGALGFVASDTILAVQLFRMPAGSRWQVPASVALWLLYAGGQCAILAGIGWQMPLFHLS